MDANNSPSNGGNGSTWLVVEGDTHAGNIHGLMNPDIELWRENEKGDLEAYTPKATAVQKFLWKLRSQSLKEILKIAQDDPIYYLHTGDQTQGKKYTEEWVSTVASDQITIAYDNTKYLVDILGNKLRAMRFAKGTPSHEFGEGTSANILQSMYAQSWRNMDIKTVWHGYANIGGINIDYAHHGPFPGSRKWLKGNSPRFYVQDKMLTALSSIPQEMPPRLILRGHYHELIWETVRHKNGTKFITTDLIIVPPQCGIGAFARQVMKSIHRVTNGLLLIEIRGANIVDVIPFTKTLDIRTKEVLD